MKITGSSKIYNTVYHNGSYLLLFGRRIRQSFKISFK